MIDNKNFSLKTNDNIFKTKKKTFVENVTLEKLSKNVPSISEFYADQNILITGGTGFMGKVLIEKLLRSCPKVNAVYLLLRSKKNYTDDDRINKIFDIPLFDRLKKENPGTLSKVKVIKGDVSEIKFGLSDTDMEFLINEINIVFHVAASVRFDDPLKKAIFINTRAAREMLRILKQMKNLKVFLHTSTTYCNIDKDVDAIEEKVYKPTTNWETMIEAAENMDEITLNFLEQKILNKYPNTYTFTKNLAEEIVSENCGDIPTVIFRPTVVICTAKEPMPGWIDNFNGPSGLYAGILTGTVRTVYVDCKKFADWVPVDIAIKGMIASVWYKALEKTELNKCLVINSSTRDFITYNNKMVSDNGFVAGFKNPSSQLLWYPFCVRTSNKYLFWFYFVTLHLIPAIFLNALLKFSKHRLNLFQLYRRIYYSNMKISLFMLNEWTFKNDNFKSLQAILKSTDKETFSVDYSTITTEHLYSSSIYGISKYLLKEKNYTKETLNERLLNLKTKYYVHVGLIGFLILGFLIVLNLYIRKFLYSRHF